MNEVRCEEVQERIPELALGTTPPADAGRMRAHLDGCPECREAWELVALLGAGRPAAPAGLAARIEGTVRFRRRAMPRPWWGAAAAAVAALALGIGVTSRGEPAAEVPAFAAEAAPSALGRAEDGMVAGAPTFADLSEEALLTLLEEMGAGPSGGAA